MKKLSETLKAASVRSFIDANPKKNFTDLDLLTEKGESKLNWANLDPKTDKTALRSYQALAKLNPDINVAEKLIGKGLISANHVARTPPKVFVAKHAADLGIDKKEAQNLHHKATRIRNKSLHLWASVRSTVASPFFRSAKTDTVSNQVKEIFEDLPSYQEIFGSLDYCQCSECHSIFGAAAYLVDLLRIIDEYVTEQNPKIPEEFLFSTRRPDIGLIPLTCGNTSTLIPYLQIVNERLKALAQQSLPNKDDLLLKEIATTIVYPRQLPFNSPLDQIKVLLDKVGAGYGAIMAAWKKPDDMVGAINLGLSTKEQAIVSTALTTAEEVAPYYDVDSADINTLSDVDIFLTKNRMTFPQLQTLVNQDLSTEELDNKLQVNFFINQGISEEHVILQEKTGSESYELVNLGISPLDRINRLLRLAATIDQTPEDTDWALRSIQDGRAPIISGTDIFDGLFKLTELGKTLSLGFAKATALLGPIKTYGQGEDDQGSAFDQLFNTPSILMKQAPYNPSGNPLNPGYTDTPLSWTPKKSDATDLAAINRILPGLGISLDAANALGAKLYGTSSALSLTVDAISILYRHALLSRSMNLPMERYLLLLELADIKGPKSKNPTAKQLTELVATNQWIEKTGISVYQLDYAINGVESVYVNPLYQPDSVNEWLAGLRTIVPFPPSSDAGGKIIEQVGILFGISTDLTNAVFLMARGAVTLPEGVTSWEYAFLAVNDDGKTPTYATYVDSVLAWVSRWLVLTQALSLPRTMIANAAACPEAYTLPKPVTAIPLSAIKAITQIQQMMKEYGDLQENLLGYIKAATTGESHEAQLDLLHKATNWEQTQVSGLLADPLKEVTNITEQLGALQICFSLMNALGANLTFMATVSALCNVDPSEWAQYTDAANLVLTKTASRYGDQWETIWPSLSGELAVNERNALLALVLSQLNSKYSDITTPENVYEFMLTEVQMGPETQISYIKEALNAAQLYLQRCRLRLEPGVEDMSHIKDEWWDWMMSYRIWEANRRIFVYPESYMVPSLRKNVTPEFSTLNQALQQSAVDDSSVDSAFHTYIDDFGNVAQIKVVDSYRTNINDTDTTYLLGRTKTAPYTFYYCFKEEGYPWKPWEKIDLTINSPFSSMTYAFNRPFIFWNEIKKNNNSILSGTPTAINTVNCTTYTVTVMYSFINQQGKWIQPQTLIDEDVVLYNEDGNDEIKLATNPIFGDIFDIESIAWRKVFVLSVTAENYIPEKKHGQGERIVVMYGPNLLNTGSTIDAESTSPTTEINGKAFWQNLHNRAEDHNRVVDDQLSGDLLFRPSFIFNLSLEGDVLVANQEFLLSDPYQTNTAYPENANSTPFSLIRANMQISGDIMQVEHTGKPILDNHPDMDNTCQTSSSASRIDGRSFINAGINADQGAEIFSALKDGGVIDSDSQVVAEKVATLDLYSLLASITIYNKFTPAQYAWVQQILYEHMEATKLFSNLGDEISLVTPVAGQPGSFLFFAAEEAFLLEPIQTSGDEPLFTTFAKGLRVSAPPLTAISFIMSYPGPSTDPPKPITADVSAAIFGLLVGFSIIKDGRPTSYATESNIEIALKSLITVRIYDEHITCIYHIVINTAHVFKDIFMDDKINEKVSGDIYDAIQGFSIIDPNNRIDESIMTGENVNLVLMNLVLQNEITREQIPGIYKRLAQSPKAIALSYVNEGNTTDISSINDFHFSVTRMSTGAIKKISSKLFAGGVQLLLSPETQDIPVVPVEPFDRFAPSTTNLEWPGALDATQVDFDGLYGQYYWEIFYHIPMLLAESLNTQQHFREAQNWLQYIFDPTICEDFVTADAIAAKTGEEISIEQGKEIITALQAHKIGKADKEAPILNSKGEVNPNFKASTDLSFLKEPVALDDEQVLMVRNILLNYQLHAPSSHYWNFRPFRNHTLEDLSDMLSDSNPAIKIYNDNPFDPFAIARVRIGAFEKTTVMQYIDNLISWGDNLFTQDTWESITAAYKLYVYAYNILGPVPEEVGECPGADEVLTFDEIKAKYPDGIPQFLIDLEHFTGKTGPGPEIDSIGHAFNDLNVYFCVSENSDFTTRWGTVQDRLFKINHSLNIKGVFRSLALFQPPFNPMDLVKASSASLNVQSTSASTPQLSPYRFDSALRTSRSLCATLIELGNTIQSLLEKKDAEGLSILRSTQCGQILDMMTHIKESRITELNSTIESLTNSKASATTRLDYYTNNLNAGLSAYENTAIDASIAALTFNILGSISKTAAAIGYAVPQVGSPFAMTYGGIQVGSAVNATSGVLEIGAEISSFIAQNALTMGGYERRNDDWTLQKNIAQADIDGLTNQIDAANAQLAGATQDLSVHMKSIDQDKTILSYITDKFTNEELYQWILGRLGAIYYQTYDLSMQVARQAEAAYQFELDSSKTLLTFDYWDSLHKGLSAGAGLRLALDRLEDAYRTEDTRRLEVEKVISLAMLAPEQLLTLRTTGNCTITLNEALFDYDYPGQYSRKIKTISISIPAVVGPYQNIKATLTQTKNSVVTEPHIDVVKYLLDPSSKKPTNGLREDWADKQSIAISKGNDDSGLFVLDFHDPRYLPFENTGAVSTWTLDMPLETNRFSFDQLSDIIIKVRYTALYDGTLAGKVRTALGTTPDTGGLFIDADMQSEQWQAFLTNHSSTSNQPLTLMVDSTQLSYFSSLLYQTVIVRLEVAEGITINDGADFLSLNVEGETAVKFKLSDAEGKADKLGWKGKTLAKSWTLDFDLTNKDIAVLLTDGFIDPEKLLDIQMVVLYDAKIF